MFKKIILSTVTLIMLIAGMNVEHSLAMDQKDNNSAFPSTFRGPEYMGATGFSDTLGTRAKQKATAFYQNNCIDISEHFIFINNIPLNLQNISSDLDWATILKELIEKNLMGYAASVISPEAVAPCGGYYCIIGSETYPGSDMGYAYYVKCSEVDKLVKFSHILNGYSFGSIDQKLIPTVDLSKSGAFRLYRKIDSKIKEQILKGYSDHKDYFERHAEDFIQRNFLCLAAICKTNDSLTKVNLGDALLDYLFSFISFDDILEEK